MANYSDEINSWSNKIWRWSIALANELLCFQYKFWDYSIEHSLWLNGFFLYSYFLHLVVVLHNKSQPKRKLLIIMALRKRLLQLMMKTLFFTHSLRVWSPKRNSSFIYKAVILAPNFHTDLKMAKFKNFVGLKVSSSSCLMSIYLWL